MKLTTVSLRNFRCYKDERTIPIDELTTIIGRNDVGKSTILHALEIFFGGPAAKIDSEDCHVCAVDKTIEITCEFSDLPESLVLDAQAETSLAAEHLLAKNGNLRIMKAFKCSAAKPKEEVFVLAQHPTVDDYCDLLDLSNAALKKRLKDLRIDDASVQLNSNPSIRHAIWNACPDLHLDEMRIPVAKEDGKRIWEKLSDCLPLYALFQSDRPSQDSDAEVQDPMKLAIMSALSEQGIKDMLGEIVEAVRKKATELAERTQATLQKIDPNLASQLTPEFKADPKWSGLFSVTLNSDQGIPVNKRGSGVRRMILVSFFRAEAERRLAEGGGTSIIYAIEEPETSQHPHSQRILLEAFQDLASEPGCQVLLTTHSPGFANYLPISSFRFVRRADDGQPYVVAAQDVIWEEMVTALGVVPDNRVRILLCVEGPTDVIDLRHLSHALHVADSSILDLLTDPRIAFVVLGGGTLSHWVNEHYLKDLARPEIHIYDSDVKKYADILAQVNQRTDGSWGIQTEKREIENYLHPDAILEGLALSVKVTDTNDVPDAVATLKGWKANTAKRKLAQCAFPHMTADHILERDPNGEIQSWLRRIGQML